MDLMAFVAIFALILSVSALSDRKFHYIDQVGENFLFRGDLPLDKNNTFAIDFVKNEFSRKALSEAGIVLPKKYELVDVTLLDFINPYEKVHIDAEKRFFEEHPEVGSILVRPLYGDLVSPKKFSHHLARKIAKKMLADHMPKTLHEVRKKLEMKYGVPIVFYWHCEAGCNRTGEISFGYYTKYLGMNANTAWKKDVFSCGKEPSHSSLAVQEWFCYLLQEEGSKTIGDDCMHFDHQ